MQLNPSPDSAAAGTVSEHLANWIATVSPTTIPAPTLEKARDILVDITGL